MTAAVTNVYLKANILARSATVALAGVWYILPT